MIDLTTTGTEPVQYRIDRRNGVVYLTLRGKVTFTDLAQAQARILDDPDYHPGTSVYFDCRVITSIPSHDQIRQLSLDQLFRDRAVRSGKFAIVAMTRLGFALATALGDFLDRGGNDVSTFTSHLAARAWLGLE
ncbi:MAG TPA: hypothetical protein VH277_11540 [Gemmatimonadaceae bacterium]|jgi:hypothetical protein|nr:hypothetical protein [Gemmatimonadaceae bacterium]